MIPRLNHKAEPIEILLVDDDPADVKLTQRVLARSKLHLSVAVVADGREAMRYLRKEGDYTEAVTPDLVLLDLNLPFKSGHEVLNEMRRDLKLDAIPVVILTSSEADHDVIRSYELHANCYVQKPVDLAEFTKVVQALENFWLTIVKLPTQK